MNSAEFMGVFHFTNWTDEDFVHLWNNEEYTFPKGTSVPLIMPKENSENIQEIRKRFAYDLAVREFYKSPQYKKMSKMGNGLPPIFDEKILEPMIEKCLKPLPMGKATVKKIELDEEKKFKSSMAMDDSDNPNFMFKDVNVKGKIPTLGKMPDKAL